MSLSSVCFPDYLADTLHNVQLLSADDDLSSWTARRGVGKQEPVSVPTRPEGTSVSAEEPGLSADRKDTILSVFLTVHHFTEAVRFIRSH